MRQDMATAAAAVIAKRRRDIVSHFLSANAVSPDTATTYEPERRVDRRLFERMTAAGVIVEAEAGRYYVSIPEYDSWNRSKRRRLGLLLGGAVAIGAAMVTLAG